MDGIILINKEKGITSRDVVNKVCKKLNTNKVGHTGTLDPLATGLMILCVNEGLKLVELLTNHDKEYIAKVKVGIKTDTYDITGKVLEEKDVLLNKDDLINTLNSFVGEYNQEVPIYSSVKVNGKKLYEYARNNEEVVLPKHLVKISNIELLDFNKDNFTFKVNVSSGTYIRSLINDIGNKLNIPMTMEELTRTRVGNYYLTDANEVDNLNIIPIVDALNIKKIEIDDNLFKKISNGVKIENIYQEDIVMFIYHNKPIAIYKNDNGFLKSYRGFNISK
jgi:tRNA pseudouridine55 synthase